RSAFSSLVSMASSSAGPHRHRLRFYLYVERPWLALSHNPPYLRERLTYSSQRMLPLVIVEIVDARFGYHEARGPGVVQVGADAGRLRGPVPGFLPLARGDPVDKQPGCIRALRVRDERHQPVATGAEARRLVRKHWF